ncbi:MAG: glycoside hydrolase family 13 protein [Bacteroidetes bacterium]|nr:glycoside hydrolase family 13 protein [Bacteroidota bacterium]
MNRIMFVAIAVAVCSSMAEGQVNMQKGSKVPAWAKKAVWYQIFPERFRNGDLENDPTARDAQVSGALYHISPWTSDWYKLQPREKGFSRKFYDVVFDRRYGGDLEGVIKELPYLRELGINAIYLNPVFESPSLHKYNTSSYTHIDRNFGPDPKGDLKIMSEENPDDPSTWRWTSADREFLKLVKKAHEMGMKVIIDGVFNHVGTDFWAFKDVEKNQQKSKYKDWFVIRSWNDSAKGTRFDYAGWWGVKSLPIFRKDSVTGLVHGPYEHIMAITKRWMEPDGNPKDGIDGWRLDVPNEIPHPFWIAWRKVVKGINPEAYITGEIWDNASPWLKGDQFDAVMNYEFAKVVVKFFINKHLAITPAQFDSTLKAIRDTYPEDVNYVLQNLIDSHDTDRLASMIVNPDRAYDSGNSPRNNPGYNVRKPDAAEIRRQKLIVLFQMTYVGAPMVYYGDEAGMWGADDPDDRKPMLWPDMKYADEKTSPVPGHKRPDDKNVFDRDLFDYYKLLIHERVSNPALTVGSCRTLVADDYKRVFVFERKAGIHTAIIGFNLSDETQTVDVATREETKNYRDVLSSKEFPVKDGNLRVEIKPGWGVLLVSQGE